MISKRLRLFTAADIILVLFILLGTAGSYIYLNNGRSDSAVYIYYRNALVGIYSLAQEQTVQINAECIAEIKDGKVRMLKSDCPDKLCVKQGWSDRFPVICLPNQIVLEIRNHKERKIHILH